jgi:hypothetical protein
LDISGSTNIPTGPLSRIQISPSQLASEARALESIPGFSKGEGAGLLQQFAGNLKQNAGPAQGMLATIGKSGDNNVGSILNNLGQYANTVGMTPEGKKTILMQAGVPEKLADFFSGKNGSAAMRSQYASTRSQELNNPVDPSGGRKLEELSLSISQSLEKLMAKVLSNPEVIQDLKDFSAAFRSFIDDLSGIAPDSIHLLYGAGLVIKTVFDAVATALNGLLSSVISTLNLVNKIPGVKSITGFKQLDMLNGALQKSIQDNAKSVTKDAEAFEKWWDRGFGATSQNNKPYEKTNLSGAAGTFNKVVPGLIPGPQDISGAGKLGAASNSTSIITYNVIDNSTKTQNNNGTVTSDAVDKFMKPTGFDPSTTAPIGVIANQSKGLR